MILPFDDLSCLQFYCWEITPLVHGLMNYSKTCKLFTGFILSKLFFKKNISKNTAMGGLIFAT